MSFNFKKALLAGTAIVAVGVLAPAAHAADLTLTGNATWGTAANGMVATPTAGDNVILGTNTLTINGSEAGVTTIGAITSTTTGAVTINNAADASVPITIGSIAITGAGNITQAVTDVTTRNVASTITGNVSTGGNLVMTNVEPDAAATNAMSIGGTLTVTGTTGITGGNFAGASTTALSVTGNTAFTGAVTVTGGANAAATATLTLTGATNTFTGGVNLVGDDKSILVLNGTAAQTVTGVISGAGDINITNTHASGVTFAGDSTFTGELTVNNNTEDQAVTFTGDFAGAIALGDNSGADTITATFTGTTLNISGGLTGGAAETVNVNIRGGSTVNQSAGAWSGIDTLAISGNTTFDSDAAVTATNTTIASGSTLNIGASDYTSAIANAGTIILSGNGDIVGAVTGAGLLDVNASTAFNGALTQGSADIGAFTLTQTTAAGYDVDTTNFSGAGTLALLGGTQTVTTNITNTTAGQGTVTISNVAGTTTIVGDIGEAADDEILAFNILGGTGQTVTTTGDIFAATMAIDDADTLSFVGSSAQTVSADITGGIMDFGTGTSATDVTFTGTLASLVTGNVDAGASVTYNGNATYASTYTQNATGATTVGGGAVLSAVSFSDAGTYTLGVTDANGTLVTGDFGSLTDNGGGVSTITNSRLHINVTGDIGTANDVLLLTSVNAGAGTLSDNSLQYTFVTANDGNDTDVDVTRVTTQSLATEQNDGVAETLEGLRAASLAGTADDDLSDIIDNLAAAETEDEFNEILESVGPAVDGGAVVGGFNASVQSIDVSNTRLASLRNGTETGMVAGQMASGIEGWVQAFGQTAEQDERSGVDGYEADTYGLAVGADTANLLENGTVGLSLSYADTNVDSKNANDTESDVTSYQVSLYGDYDVAPQTYISGTLGFAWNDIDQTRKNVGGTGLDADADYDSNQYIAYLEAGREFSVADRTMLTPHVLAHYQHISIDDYTETGAGGANLDVDSDDLNIFELGVGAELAWDLEAANGSKVRPALNVGYRHDLVGDDVSTTSTFTGGGASFDTDGLEPAEGTFNVGGGVTYALDNNWTFTADYDYEVKSDYDAHSGFVRAGYKF